MPPSEKIQASLAGAWRMMMGKPEGLRMLDLSADGFWNSFYAILLALPPLAVNWVPVALDTLGPEATGGERFVYVLRLAVVDIGAWLLPLAILAAFSAQVGVRDRFVHYVVATNWATVPMVWIMLPASLLATFAPGMGDMLNVIALALFGVTMFFSWRVTNIAIGKGAAVGSGVFAGMFVLSILVMVALQSLLDIELPAGG